MPPAIPTTELLSPAGSRKHMRYAFAYGADAVYAGQPRYSLRVRNNEFNKPEYLASAIQEAHELNKKFYLAANLAPHNDKLRSFYKDMDPIIQMGPNALIMSDPGFIMMAKDRWPDVPVHLSVQANTVNWAAVKFWHRNGIERIILSRELSLNEIEDIRQHCPEMELEVFVHGALCIAYSGRCLLSGYMTHRDSNQGACTNSCRWKYDAHEATETSNGDIVATHTPAPANQEPQANDPKTHNERIMLLQEQGRPGEYMPAFEDEHGTYIMNSKDLRAVQHVQRLIDIGVHSLKIEGRTKSPYYAARTAQVYRQAIDDAQQGQSFNIQLMDDLEKLSSRGYTEGFYRRHVNDELQAYEGGNNNFGSQQFVGEIINVDQEQQQLLIEVKNRFEVGDTLELMSPQGNHSFTLELIESEQGEKLDAAPGSGWKVIIPIPNNLPQDLDYTFALLMKEVK